MGQNNPEYAGAPTGCMQWKIPKETFGKMAGGGNDSYAWLFDASYVVPTGPQNVPQHIWQPAVLYLGRPA